MVSKGIPCMGPVTRAGCNALCPAYDRGCFGCFGPSETTTLASLIEAWKGLGMDDRTVDRMLSTFNVTAFGKVRQDA